MAAAELHRISEAVGNLHHPHLQTKSDFIILHCLLPTSVWHVLSRSPAVAQVMLMKGKFQDRT
jgi:hypothetical protein